MIFFLLLKIDDIKYAYRMLTFYTLLCYWVERSPMVQSKDSKNGIDNPLPNNQDYKVRIKGKVERFKERRSGLLNILV